MRSDNTLIEARCRHEAMDSELSTHHEHPSHGDVVSQAAPLCIPKTCVGWPSIPAVMPRSVLVSREGVLPCRYSNIVFLRVATHSVGSGGRKSGSHHALSTKEKGREEKRSPHDPMGGNRLGFGPENICWAGEGPPLFGCRAAQSVALSWMIHKLSHEGCILLCRPRKAHKQKSPAYRRPEILFASHHMRKQNKGTAA